MNEKEKKPEEKKQLRPLLSNKMLYGILAFIVGWAALALLFNDTILGFVIATLLVIVYALCKNEKSRKYIKKWWQEQRHKDKSDI